MTSTCFGLRRDQRRQVAEHPLQAHVLRLARRLDLAGVVIVQHAARQPRHRDRRVPAFADVDDVGLADPRRRVAAVRDEQRGHRAARCAPAAPRTTAADDDRRSCRRTASAARPSRPVGTASSISSAESAEMMISTCSECWLPSHDIRSRLDASDADDRADGVRGVDAADQARRILAVGGDRRRAPAESSRPTGSRRQHGPQAADEIELEVEPGAGRDRRVDRPVRQRLRCSMYAAQAIAPHSSIWHQPSATRGRADAARHRRADAAADAEAEQEHREDQRERVDRRAEEQRQHARPDHLRRRARSGPTARSST